MYPKAGKPSRRTIEKPILPSLRHSHCGTDSIADPSPFVAHIGSPIPCRKTRRRPSVACAQDRDMCPSHLFVHHYSSNVTRPTQPHQLRYNTLLSSQFLCVVHTYPLPTPVLLSSRLTFLLAVTLCTTSGTRCAKYPCRFLFLLTWCWFITYSTTTNSPIRSPYLY